MFYLKDALGDHVIKKIRESPTGMNCVKLNSECQKQGIYLPSTVLVMVLKRLQHDGSVTGGGQAEAADVLRQEGGSHDDVGPRGEGTHPLHQGAVRERSCMFQWRHT